MSQLLSTFQSRLTKLSTMAVNEHIDTATEKGDVLYHEEATTVSPPSEPRAVGAEASMTWKTWLVIVVSISQAQRETFLTRS